MKTETLEKAPEKVVLPKLTDSYEWVKMKIAIHKFWRMLEKDNVLHKDKVLFIMWQQLFDRIVQMFQISINKQGHVDFRGSYLDWIIHLERFHRGITMILDPKKKVSA